MAHVVLDEYANHHYKDLQEMLNSPEYKAFTKKVRQGGSRRYYNYIPTSTS